MEDVHCIIQVGGKLPRGSIMLELRRLRALGLQEQLRAQVEKEQAEIMGMTLIAYRKFARNCQSNRYTSSVHRVVGLPSAFLIPPHSLTGSTEPACVRCGSQVYRSTGWLPEIRQSSDGPFTGADQD